VVKPVTILTRIRTVTHGPAAGAEFQLNFSDVTETAALAIIWEKQKTSIEFIKTFSRRIAFVGNALRVDGRNESANPRSVFPPWKILRLPDTAAHLGRIDAQIVAKEIHFFVGGCADDTDLL